jgi:hypothetical protein
MHSHPNILLTPQKMPTVHINPFAMKSILVSSAKDGNGSRAQSNQKSPNTQMKELTGALDSNTLTINPQSKGKHQ